ncbi:hypothetical protein [Longimicrobium sp.]|uniref:hypothetical protein n=1 Tax=Longimicrobium sp. TaxID=2029185 RepID=UPI002E35A7AF|nr:hypothetical protein [Longimicrobium sp.]HEX6040124.1 hypothetical protein [Longimicrobium sp.]
MEGILALMIPVLAMATGLVAAIRMPRDQLANRRRWGRRWHNEPLAPAADPALATEVALLREELAQVRERLDFTERLLMDAAPVQRIATPAVSVPAAAPSPLSVPLAR